MSYVQGGRLRFGNHAGSGAAAFTDLNGTATDPTEIVLTILRADGTELAFGYPVAGADGTLTREATGRYYCDVTLDTPGVWRVKLDGDGAVVATAQSAITVARSLVL